MTRILRRPDVERITGLSTSTIYEKIAAGAFPRPIRLGLRAVGWVEEEVQAWLERRLEEREAGVGSLSNRKSKAA
jgi:prophage regulatory protein